MDKEKYFEALKNLGQQTLAGFDNDFEKATEGLNQINEFLSQNPMAINFLTSPSTAKMFEPIIPILTNNKLSEKGKMLKVMGLFFTSK